MCNPLWRSFGECVSKRWHFIHILHLGSKITELKSNIQPVVALSTVYCPPLVETYNCGRGCHDVLGIPVGGPASYSVSDCQVSAKLCCLIRHCIVKLYCTYTAGALLPTVSTAAAKDNYTAQDSCRI